MPGTSNFPAALDTFPDIDPNTKEDEVNHDELHNNIAAALIALQTAVGITDSDDVDSLVYKIANLVVSDSSAVTEVSIVSGVATFDLAAGKFFICRVTENIDEVRLDNEPATGFGAQAHILFIQDDTTAFTVGGFPAGVFWFGDAYEISTDLEAIDEVVLTFYGTTRISGKYLKGAVDSFPSFASALLNFDGTDGSTTFTDETGKTWTGYGNAQIDTAESVFGGSSLLLDGTGDYISTPDHADFELGSGMFSIQAWIRPAAYAKLEAGTYNSSIISKDVFGDRGFNFFITGSSSAWDSLGFIAFSSNAPTYQLLVATTTIVNDDWEHVGVFCDGSNLYLSKGGVIVDTLTGWTTTIQETSTDIVIGAQNYDSTYKREFNGHIGGLLFEKGVCRHTTDFTVPAGPFTL